MSGPAVAGRDPVLPLRLTARAGAPLGLVFGGIGLVGGLAVGLLHLDQLKLPLCYVKALSGVPCPTCGSTRAIGRLYALDPAGALAMNPLATLAALVIVAWALGDLVLLPRRRALGLEVAPRMGVALRVAAVAAVLLNWAYLLAVGR